MSDQKKPACGMCGKDLGDPVSGFPIQANRTVYYEHGEARVSWEGRFVPRLYGYTCDDCAAAEREEEENDPNYGLLY